MSKPTIILVDDDAAIRQSLKFSLELEGYSVLTFSSAEAVCRISLPENGCLVLDYNLPGDDGLTLLAALRRRGVRLPAILITTNPSASLRLRAAAENVSLVEKPLLCDELALTVRQLLAA